MRLQRHVCTLTAAAVLGSLAIVGCTGDTGESSGPPATMLTPDGLELDAPSSYDPCVGVTQEILDQLRLVKAKNPNTADFDGPKGRKWRGCSWVRPYGYGISIRTTNLTLDGAQKIWNKDVVEFTIGDRRAIGMHRSDTDPEESCAINVEIQGGSLEIYIDNPPAVSRDTGHMDSCELGRGAAELVVGTLPSGA
ncbi:DUF3558 domain-containing protein [Nocardia sp. NPDC059177]|uniref:DUF3558 domain-containing protein n=1 Tax=Nocardia sp. NPDC059177 TaxID=3346759 RepID=UPI00367620CB